MSTTCSDDVSELLLYGFISTMWIHLHNGSISIHSTWQLLVSIHIHAIFPNVSWSVMVPNPEGGGIVVRVQYVVRGVAATILRTTAIRMGIVDCHCELGLYI